MSRYKDVGSYMIIQLEQGLKTCFKNSNTELFTLGNVCLISFLPYIKLNICG